jgi:hypothetical protein
MNHDPNLLIHNAIRRFLICTLATAAILGIIYAFAMNTRLAHYFSPAIPWLLIFFVVTSNLVYYLQLRATQTQTSKFINIAMLSSGFRFIVFLMILIIYGMLNRNDAVRFIIAFLILYFIFTPLEVISLHRTHQKLKSK